MVTFDESGTVLQRHFIGAGYGAMGADIAAGVWHTVVPLSEVLVCYEVKPGPWDPSTDKEFAGWAPAEGSAECERFMADWIAAPSAMPTA